MADINSQDENGNTPLMDKILKKEVTIVKDILEKYKSTINPNKKNLEGKTALMLLCSYDVEMYMTSESHEGPYTVLNLVNTLLSLGPDVNMKDNEGCTALMLASKYCHSLLVERLIATNRVSDINEKTYGIYGYGSSTAYDLANQESNKNRKGVGPYTKYSQEEYMFDTRQKYVLDTLKKAMENKPVKDGSSSKSKKRKCDGRRVRKSR